jgi:signal transduction histidine kinase
MAQQSSHLWFVVERVLPWLVLAVLAVSTYSKFFLIPYAGFEFANGKISGIYVNVSERNSLHVNDQLVKVGPVEWVEFSKNLRLTIFDKVSPGQIVKLFMKRDNQTVSVDWIYPGATIRQVLERLNSQWWIGYVFWLAGLATLLFIRPKDTRWLLLIALNYLTALWLAASSGPSHWHIGESAILLRAAVWLCVPVYLHFHWIFPKPLARLPAQVWGILYLAAGVLVVLQWFQILPPSAYYVGFIFSLIGSVLFLIAHYSLQPAFRRDIHLLVLGAVLVSIPPLIVSIAFLLGLNPPAFTQGGSMLALTALPGAYFISVYRRQFGEQMRRMNRLISFYFVAILFSTLFVLLFSLLYAIINLGPSTLVLGIASTLLTGIIATSSFFPFLALPALTGLTSTQAQNPASMELRANRLVSYYLFVILVGAILTVLILIADTWISFPGSASFLGALAAILAVIITLTGFTPFQRLVEQHLLDIPLPPTQLVETYAARITTSLDSDKLIHLLKDEVLPSLLVRQSAILFLNNNKLHTLFTVGIEEDQLPAQDVLPSLLEKPEIFRYSQSEDYDQNPSKWIRLLLPLKVNEELVGVWLFGRRDPDNLYTSTEISVLQSIANQTAIAMENITQAKHLRALYQANIDRQENERMSLARGLHDEVLNQLAALVYQVDDLNNMANFRDGIQSINTYLLQAIEDLRPAMMAYGLWPALQQLVDELSERAGNVKIQIDIPENDVRYDPQGEQHLFRIVQQACENALRHANAKFIYIKGQIEPGNCFLAVEDDGIGFPTDEYLDLTVLLSRKHFGLAGMFERAALIGAELKINSIPGSGTRVLVNWRFEKTR